MPVACKAQIRNNPRAIQFYPYGGEKFLLDITDKATIGPFVTPLRLREIQ
jgi:hypothetical protein